MGDSKIEWTEKTWNPVTGCSKVSQGCKNCYALRLFPKVYPGRDFTDVRTHENRLDAPLHWRKPARIFVNSMSDLFHEKVPFEFIDKVFAVMALCPQHTFQILTKRPERMLEYCNQSFTEEGGLKIGRAAAAMFRGTSMRDRNLSMAEQAAVSNKFEWRELFNVWLGVSVEDQKTADERIPLLLQTPAAVRWVSYEPALGPVDFRHIHYDNMVEIDSLTGDHGVIRPLQGRSDSRLNWIVCGGESGPKARPMHPEWARSVRDQCQVAGVPYFFKQWGAWEPISTTTGMHESPFGYNVESMLGFTKVGKKIAGRSLDGRTWDEYPKVSLSEAR